MRTFRYPSEGSWRSRGQAHGEAFAGEIRSLAALRLYLCRRVGGFSSDGDVLALATKHLPVLKAFSADRFDELNGIADGARCSPEEVVVLNHYTDLRDLGGVAHGAIAEDDASADGCTVVFAKTAEGPVLAQTWDMHASAIPYVLAIEVPSIDGAPAQTTLSLTGCLGMAGLSGNGVAIAINNLHSRDAQVGVVWSALVRETLAQASAAAARDRILSAPVGSGHHYVVADGSDVFGIETSGTTREIIYSGEQDLYVHTNHCLDETVTKQSRVPDGSTTYDRLTLARSDAEATPIVDAADAFVRLGSEVGYPRSVCTNMSSAQRPHAAATCGALSINTKTKRMLACAGFPHGATPTVFEVSNR